jgi:hypothetical protein
MGSIRFGVRRTWDRKPDCIFRTSADLHDGACFLPVFHAMRRTMIGAAVGLAGLLAGESVAGQQPAACAAPAAAADSLSVPVVVIARVHADAVVFETDPDVRVTVNGCDPLPGQVRTTSNLPDPIEPGVRYTNVEITTEYRAWLTVECRAPADVAARLCEELRRRD